VQEQVSSTFQIEAHDCSSVQYILPQQWPYGFLQTSVGSFPLNQWDCGLSSCLMTSGNALTEQLLPHTSSNTDGSVRRQTSDTLSSPWNVVGKAQSLSQ